MRKYPKIYGPYNRYTEGPHRNKLIEGDWTSLELDHLQDTPWVFTEKVDGTNIRVGWDGHSVSFGGRTDSAQIPGPLLTVLRERFPEELLEQAFGEQSAVLYGEGFGKGIQKGAVYRSTMDFILFDVLVDQWWLQRESMEDVAAKMGLELVPVVMEGSLHDGIKRVKDGLNSAWGDFPAEGLVGVTKSGMLDRSGSRISVKIKTRDFAR